MSDRKEMTGRESGGERLEYGEKSGDGRIVLCGANSYEQKILFQPGFQNASQIRAGGAAYPVCAVHRGCGRDFTIIFEPDGGVTLETTAAEEDFSMMR